MALTEEFIIKSDFRESHQGLDDLALSIQSNGLLNPITVRPCDEGFEVLAGRRRFRAMTNYLGWKSLKKNEHFIVKEGVDGLIAQFQENFNREDFTPVEMARLVKAIHDQQIGLHGQAVKGQSGGWGLKDTGKMIGRDSAFISRMLSIAENEEDVKECKTVSEAMETVDKKKRKSVRSALQKVQAEKREAQTPPELDQLIDNVEACEVVKYLTKLPSNSVDLVLTDPPYGIDYDDLHRADSLEAYSDKPEDLFDVLRAAVPEYYRVLRDDKYCIIWTAFEHLNFLSNLMEESGFKVAATPIVWVKTNSPGKSMNPDKTLASLAEVGVYGWKGDGELAKHGLGNVFPINVVNSTDRIHVAQKPDKLYREVLDIFSYKSDVVLDTFAGSLACLRACYTMARDFRGCELYQEYLSEAVNYTRNKMAE